LDGRTESAQSYRYGFNGMEADDEVKGSGNSYTTEFRQYDAGVGRWLSLDPLKMQFPSWTPYNFVYNNALNLVDRDGKAATPPSTHIDEKGNVIEVKEDGNLGVYKHSEEEIKNGNLENDERKKVGVTLYEKSFIKGDKIDLSSFRARDWINSFENGQQMLTGILPIGYSRKIIYAIHAKNNGAFDPKSYLPGGIGGGSQISKGVYISNRDIGNYAAGAFARINGYDKQSYLAETGAFQLSGNNLEKFFSNHNAFIKLAYSHKPTDGAFQRTYGEDDRSNYFIRLGYENIRTLDQFNSRFSTIFFNDNRNYKLDEIDK
jgi:RHS repeat-associated protein